jgi:chemotaxis response regulator CheB
MRAVRVLIGPMPRMIRDMVIAILETAPEIEVMEERAGARAIPRAVRRARADVIIVGEDAVSTADRERLLFEECRLKVLAVSTGGTRASLEALQPVEISLGEITARELIAVIRSCASDA